MLASDAIDYLIAQLDLAGVGAADDGATEFHFEQPFPFTVTEVSDQTIALFAPLPVTAAAPLPRVLRRLLEANLQGAETGPGAMCQTASGVLGYRDVIDLTELTLDAFRLRFVDYSLYYEYWRSEGARLLDLGDDGTTDPDMLRL